jgi:hypothetical protein
MTPIVWVMALAFTVMGICAYTGVWKGWARVVRGFGTTIGFSWLYLGIGFTLMASALLFAESSRTLFLVLFGVAIAVLLFAVVAFWWLPPVLLPDWFKKARAAALRREKTR